MDINLNYYEILGVNHTTEFNDIKKAYYKLSFQHHPDKKGDKNIFDLLAKAYAVLSDDEKKSEYDKRSKYGSEYSEYFELFNINIEYDYDLDKRKIEEVKKREIVDIIIDIDDTFNGELEYDRYVKCKKCDGTGKDLLSKIEIKDSEGNVIKSFEGDEGCEFCDGTGEDDWGRPCRFCSGAGKVGMSGCITCKGDGRILGRQKLKNIKTKGDETIIPSSGHYSKDVNRIGNLILRNSHNIS